MNIKQIIFNILLMTIPVTLSASEELWVTTGATTASILTGGGRITSSDSLLLKDGNIALITYWQVLDLDRPTIYRCIDTVDSNFHTISQTCSKVLMSSGTSN